MPLSTEIFMMCIFIVGLPLFDGLLRDSELIGAPFFLLSYLLLFFTNIFTVVEEFWLNTFFNFCEHAFITASSILLFIAIFRMTATPKETGPSWVMGKPVERGRQ